MLSNIEGTIVVIEDDGNLSAIYKQSLQYIKHYYVAAIFNSCENALKEIKNIAPNLIILDIELPGMNGIDGIPKLKKLVPDAKVLVISANDDLDMVITALNVGADGYASKDIGFSEILTVVDKVLNGEITVCDTVLAKLLHSFKRDPESPLSKRETEVLEYFAEGKTYKHISKELGISPQTVLSHLQHVYIKLNVINKTDAILFSREKGYISRYLRWESCANSVIFPF